MGFEEATSYVKGYLTSKVSNLKDGSRKKWFASGVEDLDAFVDMFSREELNKQWSEEYNKDNQNKSIIVNLTAKINWMCSTYRDIRKSFMINDPPVSRGSVVYDFFDMDRTSRSITNLSGFLEL